MATESASMKRLGIILTGAAVGLFATSCKRDEQDVLEKLEKIESKLASIEAKLGNSPRGRGRGAAAKPRGPNPNAVYAVDLSGSPYEGVADAKVTVVEAFEFA